MRPVFHLPCRPIHTTLCFKRWLASKANRKTDDPIPFSKSKARTFRLVDDVMTVNDEVIKKRSYAVPIGLLLFATIIYTGFIRRETVKDKKAMDYLTQDISDKIPQERRDALLTDTHQSAQHADQ